jgi:hypothetical protein
MMLPTVETLGAPAPPPATLAYRRLGRAAIRSAHRDLAIPGHAADAGRFFLDDLPVVLTLLGLPCPPPAVVRRRVTRKLSAMIELRKPAPAVVAGIEAMLRARGLALRPPREGAGRKDLIRALRLHQGRRPSVAPSDR